MNLPALYLFNPTAVTGVFYFGAGILTPLLFPVILHKLYEEKKEIRMPNLQLVAESWDNGEVVSPDHAPQALQDIDAHFTPTMFHDIVLAAYYKMQDTHLIDKNDLGVMWHAYISQALREQSMSFAWTLQEILGGIFLMVSPCKGKSIIVAMGTSDVGKENGHPSTTAKKGVTYERAIKQGRLNLPDTCQLWVLLFHCAPDHLQFELSSPKDFSRGKIEGYTKRILFGAISVNAIEPEISRQTHLPAFAEEPMAERKRKTA